MLTGLDRSQDGCRMVGRLDLSDAQLSSNVCTVCLSHEHVMPVFVCTVCLVEREMSKTEKKDRIKERSKAEKRVLCFSSICFM